MPRPLNLSSHCQRAIHHRWCLLFAVVCVAFTCHSAKAADDISFNRDIRPILTNHCFACHGPDAAAAAGDLRLDLRDAAIEHVIVPGDAQGSELVDRIVSQDEDVVMPPPELHKPLNETQIDLLQRWIDGGATYEQHWSYTPLTRPAIPDAPQSAKDSNPIDLFVAKQLRKQQLKAAAPADRITLIRRLSFDLTGLPPTAKEVEDFVTDQSPNAYFKLTQRLLNSPRYGERMAMYWLDLVRYADTVGYHGDQNVSVSPYRDYVISAFNSNLPYDRFVKEQLAGDLLPTPTIQQRVATGYNRLNQTTEEGGAQPKEYLAIYFADRVRNVSQVFMGATVGCAQCHDHKYDPYTAKDFYALGAFFADMDERGKYGGRERKPEMAVPTQEESLALLKLRQELTRQQMVLRDMEDGLAERQLEWELQALNPTNFTKPIQSVWLDDKLDIGGSKSGAWKFASGEDVPVHSGKSSRPQASAGLIQHYFLNAEQTVNVEEGTEFYAWVYLDPTTPPEAIMLQFHAGKERGDWNHRAVWGGDQIPYGRQTKSHAGYQRMGERPKLGEWVRLTVEASSVGLKVGDVVNGTAFTQFSGTVHWDQLGWIQSNGLSSNVIAALKTSPSDRSEDQVKLLAKTYLAGNTFFKERQEAVFKAERELTAASAKVTTTLITKAVPPRPIRILNRGNWMDDTGELVEPAIPEFLGTLNTSSRPTRLDLADWLCQDDNVLTSRTMVNRLWYLMFGAGICSSVDDLGGQGTYPSHPELLDYLAVEFVQSNWDIKHLLTLIVNSDTYRQSSNASTTLRKVDPYNKLLAVQGRFRIAAEMVRDTSLFHSGLLVEQIGGRSTRPYQPAGYFAQLNFPKRTYQADKGESQYRRGIYTHWQRTFLHPMLKAFDAPSREECTAQRAQSNTPLQALALLNDPTFLEAARKFAERAIVEQDDSVEGRIQFLYRTAVSRPADDFVMAELKSIYERQYKYFTADADAAAKFVSVGQSPKAEGIDVAELAAWTSVARVILNLSETTTRY
ncbi:MAG: PSD1 and planctomycete cytochrome C domain-containing protein [Fuerstiella sp.]